MVPQEVAIYEDLTAYENVHFCRIVWTERIGA